MIEFTNSIEVRQPVDKVFSFLANLENLPKWNYLVIGVKKVSKGKVGPGTRYHQVRKTDEQVLEITEFDLNQSIAVATISTSYPRLEMHLVCEASGERTKIIDHWKLDTGKPAILEKLATRNIRTAVSENLGKLKQLMETGNVILQDGRRVSI